MTQNVDRLIERIQNLIALSASPNEHEAAAAANKVQELLGQYNLTMADIEAKGTKEAILHDDDLGSESRPWYRKCAQAAAGLLFCEYYYTFLKEPAPHRKWAYIRSDVHNFVGRETNVAVAKMMFAYFVAVIKEAAKQGAAKLPKKDRTKYINAFQWAAGVRLLQRVEERVAQSKAGKAKDSDGRNLPALLDVYEQAQQENRAHIESRGVTIHYPKERNAVHSWKGALEGTEAAEDIGLDAQVEKKQSAKRITNRSANT